MIIHKSFNDFILFLYIHISQADSTYDPTEIQVIKTKMSGLFTDEVDFEKKLYNTIRQYNSFDKSNLQSLFQDTLNHFHFNSDGSLEKTQVFRDLQEIIGADGKIDTAESHALETLKQMIELSK